MRTFTPSFVEEDSADQAPQTAELLLSTHLTVVVRARISASAASAGQAPRELGLVIARQHCAGDQPSRQALLQAVQRCAAQYRLAPSEIEVCMGNRWLSLSDNTAEATAPSKGKHTMNTTPAASSASHARRFHTVAALSCAGLLALAVAGPATADTAQDNYCQERANCLSGNTSQDRQTCLREAGAALQEARRGGLSTPSAQMQARNAEARCQSQPKADRIDCLRLSRGEGTQDGTVAQGAIVRQIATLQVEPPAAGASAPRH